MIYPGQKKPEKSPLSDSDSGYPPRFYRAYPVRRKRNTKKRIFPCPPGKRQSSTEISFPYENPSVNRQMKDLSTPCRSSGTVSFSFFKQYPRKILLEILGAHAGVLSVKFPADAVYRISQPVFSVRGDQPDGAGGFFGRQNTVCIFAGWLPPFHIPSGRLTVSGNSFSYHRE